MSNKTTLTPPFNFPDGHQLGKNYQVLEFLGQGWEGEVYKVEENDTGAIRAAKFFYEHEGNRQSLLKYARKLVRLSRCPIIIQYFHRDFCYFKRQRLDFLVSDYVDGEVLSNIARRRRSVFETLHIFYAIVKGIEQIHNLGEYHGDIHMDNIIIRRKGIGFEIHLIDLMDTGQVSRTKIKEDVYDLILVLYELLGGPRFYGNAPDFIKAIILGKRKTKVFQKYRNATDLRLQLEQINWD